MKCPSCNQTPASFLRFSLSLQGVSIVKSMQGYLKCQHCGTLLRVTNYGKQFWILFAASLVLLALFVVLYQQLLTTIGTGTTAALWVGLVLLIGFTFMFGLWKYAQIAAVEKGNDPAPAPSAR